MNDARVWVSQCTADIKVIVSLDQLTGILTEAKDKLVNPVLSSSVDLVLQNVTSNGHDHEIQGFNHTNLVLLEGIVASYVPEDRWVHEIGGSPAISAIADYEFTRNGAQAFFAGNNVATVDETLREENERYQPIFSGNRLTDARPRTLSLEVNSGGYKIMFPYSEGRELPQLFRQHFFNRLQQISSKRNVFIGLGGLNKGTPQDYLQLVREIKERTDFSGIYIGTNSFSKFSPGKILGYLEVCYQADVVSFNDSELRQVYKALGGDTEGDKKPLGQMLLELDSLALANDIEIRKDQIKVCHAASGAIIHTTGAYADINSSDLTTSLSTSVDATTIKYQTGVYPSEGWVRNTPFSSRQNSEFVETFGEVSSLEESGLIYAIAPRTIKPLGSTTGLGAIFDGILASYFSAYVLSYKVC